MSRTLINISQDMQAFDQMLAEKEDDIEDPEIQEVLVEWAEELRNDLEEKADNIAAYIKVLNSRAKIRKEESKRLRERARIDSNNADRLEDHFKRTLEQLGIKKVETDRYSLVVCNNGGRQPIEVNVKPEDLPEKYQTVKTTYKKDSKAILDDLKEGKEIGGCRLLPRGSHLRIR